MKLSILLILCLLLGSCSTIALKNTPRMSESGVDICKTDLKVFKLAPEEKMSTPNQKNAALLNCILIVKCGAPASEKIIELCEGKV